MRSPAADRRRASYGSFGHSSGIPPPPCFFTSLLGGHVPPLQGARAPCATRTGRAETAYAYERRTHHSTALHTETPHVPALLRRPLWPAHRCTHRNDDDGAARRCAESVKFTPTPRPPFPLCNISGQQPHRSFVPQVVDPDLLPRFPVSPCHTAHIANPLQSPSHVRCKMKPPRNLGPWSTPVAPLRPPVKVSSPPLLCEQRELR